MQAHHRSEMPTQTRQYSRWQMSSQGHDAAVAPPTEMTLP